MGNIKHKIKSIGYKCVHGLIGLVCPVKKKKMLCRSFLGLSYSDNPRAISEKMHEIDPDWEIVWAFKEPDKKKNIVPSYVKCISGSSLSFIYHQATSRYWVENYCISSETIKRKGQIYIQTWHGDRGMKKILADMYDDQNQLNLFESENCDLAVAGSKFGEETYRSAFKYQGKIMIEGCPRNDVLINKETCAVENFKQQYHIPDNTNLLLYAPTFRDNLKGNNQCIHEINVDEVLRALETKTGKTWVMLSRGHTGRHLSFQSDNTHLIVDVTDYEDAKIILLASDAVITDYGSIGPDFALLGRPIYFFMNDMEEYERNSRSLRFKLEETPFWYAKNQAELLSLIENCTPEKAKENCQAILDFYGAHETGHASEAICNYMIQMNVEV